MSLPAQRTATADSVRDPSDRKSSIVDRRDLMFQAADAGGECVGVAQVGTYWAGDLGAVSDMTDFSTGSHAFDGLFALSMVAIMAANSDKTERELHVDTMMRLAVIGVARLATTAAELFTNSPLAYSTPLFPILAGWNLICSLYQLYEARKLLDPVEWLKHTVNYISQLEEQLRSNKLSDHVRAILEVKLEKLEKDYTSYALVYLDNKHAFARAQVMELTKAAPRFQAKFRADVLGNTVVNNGVVQVRNLAVHKPRADAIKASVTQKVNSSWGNVAARAALCVGAALLMVNATHPAGWVILAVVSAYYVFRQREVIAAGAVSIMRACRNFFASNKPSAASVEKSTVLAAEPVAKDPRFSASIPQEVLHSEPLPPTETGLAVMSALAELKAETERAATPDPGSP